MIAGVNVKEIWLSVRDGLLYPVINWLQTFFDWEIVESLLENMSVLTIIVLIFLVWKWVVSILRFVSIYLSSTVDLMDRWREVLKEIMKGWIDRL